VASTTAAPQAGSGPCTTTSAPCRPSSSAVARPMPQVARPGAAIMKVPFCGGSDRGGSCRDVCGGVALARCNGGQGRDDEARPSVLHGSGDVHCDLLSGSASDRSGASRGVDRQSPCFDCAAGNGQRGIRTVTALLAKDTAARVSSMNTPASRPRAGQDVAGRSLIRSAVTVRIPPYRAGRHSRTCSAIWKPATRTARLGRWKTT
jgi:hypothetical protein